MIAPQTTQIAQLRDVPDVPVIRPQAGPQERFLASPADIAIYGGAAGGGKTFALLMEPLRHIHHKKFGAVILRRLLTSIKIEGGMWDESQGMYPNVGGEMRAGDLSWSFRSGCKITFSGIEHLKDLKKYQGAQINLIEFDQLEEFEEQMFFFMFSRNRSVSGIPPYIRATANPQPGWLANFLDWWIDEDGFANMDRAGKIRWFVRKNGTVEWADHPKDLEKIGGGDQPKSVTFIPASVYDNPILLAKDPGYLSNLQALSLVDRLRLLGDPLRGGNWKVQPEAGTLFNKAWFEIVDAVPAGGIPLRFWDLAATEKKVADYTASVKGKIVGGDFVNGKIEGGTVYILDVTNEQIEPARTNETMKNTAAQDGPGTVQRFEREGGASGKRDAHFIVSMLAGYDVAGIAPQGDKITRQKPVAAQAYAGNVKLLRAPWNEPFLNHLHGQPDLPNDDMADGLAGMYNELVKGARLPKARSWSGA